MNEKISTNLGVRENEPKNGDVELIRGNTSQSVDVVYSKWKGLRPYKIIRAPQYLIEEWKSEIDKIIEALNTVNISKLKELVHPGSYDDTVKILSEESLDETDKKLLAIGLFVLREKSQWRSIRAKLKVAIGGEIPMEDTLSRDGNANCFDISVLIIELAKEYGIDNVEMYDHGWEHSYLTIGNKVLDPQYGYKQGGFFLSKEEYAKYLKSKKK